MLEHHQVFNQAAKSLVTSNKQRQSSIRVEFPGMSDKGWSLEFCTIEINAGRRSGSTHTAIEISQSLFENPVIITLNIDKAEQIIRQIKKPDQNIKITNSDIDVLSINEISKYVLKPSCDGVIVDCCSIIERTSDLLDKVYAVFSPLAKDKDFCFVLLG